MTRSPFLCLLLLISYASRAQTTRVDTAIPQKLQLNKKELYKPAFASNLPPQHPAKKKDSVHSIMYAEAKPRDTMRFFTPPVQKIGKSDIKITTGADRYKEQHH
jgi:hypothetical protein